MNGYGYSTPLILTIADVNTAFSKNNGETRVNYRQPISFVTVVECRTECRIYANDNRTNLSIHLYPGQSGVFELPVPAQTLLLVWGSTVTVTQNTDIALYVFVGQDEPSRSLSGGSSVDTLYTRSTLSGAPLPPPILTSFPYSAQLTYATLGYMVASDAIISAALDAVESHALTNANLDSQSRHQLLSVAPYVIPLGSPTGAPWDGSVSVPGTVTVQGTVTANQGTPATQGNAWYTRQRELNAFGAFFRLSTRPRALSSVFAGAGRVQFATIFNVSTNTVTAKLRSCLVVLESSSAAASIVAELVRINTAPATGNPLINERDFNVATAAQCVTLALPTTPGTEAAGAAGAAIWNAGVTGAASVVSPPPPDSWVELIPPAMIREGIYPTMRQGQNDGYAVVFDVSAAATVKGFVSMVWTEE